MEVLQKELAGAMENVAREKVKQAYYSLFHYNNI